MTTPKLLRRGLTDAVETALELGDGRIIMCKM